MAKLNPALKQFWRTKADLRILKGGRASSKTWDAAGIAIYLAANYKLKFLAMRQFQNKIQESVYSILCIQIDRLGYTDEFEIQKTTIIHKTTGSTFHFYGINRNINEIKGFEGADIGWIEEAEGLTQDQWSVIEPTLRKEGAQAWIIYNPKFVNDFVESFEHDPENGVIVRQINYDENPFLSQTMIRKINRMKENDPEEHKHIYLGQPLSDDDRVIINYSWLMAAIDIHKYLNIEPTGSVRTGFDVADEGADKNAMVHGKGFVIQHIYEWKDSDPNSAANECWDKALLHGSEEIIFDSIGVGAGAKGELRNEVDRHIYKSKIPPEITPFMANDSVIDPDDEYQEGKSNKDMFLNIKAQLWWDFRDRCYNAWKARNGKDFDANKLVSFDSDTIDDKLLKSVIKELSQPRREYLNGKIQVEPKAKMIKRQIKSPNIADAAIMFIKPKEVNPFMAYNPR
jgi:phage terminase large subunit